MREGMLMLSTTHMKPFGKTVLKPCPMVKKRYDTCTTLGICVAFFFFGSAGSCRVATCNDQSFLLPGAGKTCLH